MAFVLEFEINELPKMTNGGNKNWRATHYERQKWKNAVASICLMRRPEVPLKKAKLTLTRFSSVCPDYDNMAISFKGVCDGLVLGRVIEDDKMTVIGMPDFKWEKVSPGEGKIKVRVEGIE